MKATQMSKQAIKQSLSALAIPLLLTGCIDATPATTDADTSNDRIAVTKLEITSTDDPYLLHPVRVAIEAELSGEAYETDLLIAMRSSDGEVGCVLGAMPVAHAGDAQVAEGDEQAVAPTRYANEAEFVVDRVCYELVGRDDIELFASFDPWNQLKDREVIDDDSPSAAQLDIYSIVSAAALSDESCETCETHYSVLPTPGLDAQLREVNVSSVVAVLPVAGASRVQPVVPNRPDFSVTTVARVTGLAQGEGLDDGRVQLSYRIRPLGSSDDGLPLIQRDHDVAAELAAVPVPSYGDVTVGRPLYIQDATRDALTEGVWAQLEEFELVTCVEADFDQAIFAGESEPRANDCAAVPLVIVREQVGDDGLPLPHPGAATATEADVWGDSWGANAGYGFGYSGLSFEAWLDVNGTDSSATTYGGISVLNPGSWFEAGVLSTATVFGTAANIVDIYATFIGYDFGGGGVAMGASIFIYEFIPEFEIQLSDGVPLSLQEMLDAADLDIETSLTKSLTLAGVNFNDGCGSVSAGLWIEGTLGIDTEQTTITASTTSQGVEVAGTVTPFMDIAAKAGTTVSYGEYVSGGITATLNLLEIDVPFTVEVEVIDYAPLSAFRLAFDEYASAFLTTLSGNIKFNIKWDLGPWCFWNCSGSHEHTIATWSGFNTSVALFDLTQNINVGTNKPNGSWCTHGGSELYTGDFNADGAADYLCHDTGNGFKWLDYQSGGSFGGTDWERSANWCTTTSKQLLVGDFNGDNRDDMLCHSSSTKWIDYTDSNSQLMGTDWSASSTWCTHSGAVLKAQDMNNDGRDDLYCYDSGGSKWIDYADANGVFGGTDWTGTTLPINFCDTYDGELISLKTHHNRYVKAETGGAGWVAVQAPTIGAWERFTVVCTGDLVSFKSAHNRYLQANSGASDYIVRQQTSIGDWEKFTAVQQDDKWAFLTAHGRYLQARDANNNNNWILKQQTFIGDWEKFAVVPQ